MASAKNLIERFQDTLTFFKEQEGWSTELNDLFAKLVAENDPETALADVLNTKLIEEHTAMSRGYFEVKVRIFYQLGLPLSESMDDLTLLNTLNVFATQAGLESLAALPSMMTALPIAKQKLEALGIQKEVQKAQSLVDRLQKVPVVDQINAAIEELAQKAQAFVAYENGVPRVAGTRSYAVQMQHADGTIAPELEALKGTISAYETEYLLWKTAFESIRVLAEELEEEQVDQWLYHVRSSLEQVEVLLPKDGLHVNVEQVPVFASGTIRTGLEQLLTLYETRRDKSLSGEVKALLSLIESIETLIANRNNINTYCFGSKDTKKHLDFANLFWERLQA